MIEQTLVVIKPDGVQRCLAGRIIQRFEDVGLKIIGMKMVWVNKEFTRQHYKEHLEKHFYPGLEALLTVGPVIAIVIEGVNAIAQVRKMVGSTEPKSAAPGTIRGDFSHVTYEFADKKGVTLKNLIHASDSDKNAKIEIKLWFKKDELHAYKTVHDMHTIE